MTIDDPLIVLTRASESHLYVMVFDPRDLSAMYTRGGLQMGRGVVTSRDSLPDVVRDYFRAASDRLSDEWNAVPANGDPAPDPLHHPAVRAFTRAALRWMYGENLSVAWRVRRHPYRRAGAVTVPAARGRHGERPWPIERPPRCSR